MIRFTAIAAIFFFSFLTGCVGVTQSKAAAVFDDLSENATRTTVAIPEKVYRIGETGICGRVGNDHIMVTHVIPGSPAHGKVRVGDRFVGMQHRGMGGWGGIPNLVRVRLYRIGRDWDYHFYVTVERPRVGGGKSQVLVYDLHMPPEPGNICHYGPTGFFAERHPDHLVVSVIDKDSPADGKLMKGDVILAVDGEPITREAYQQFTKAVDHAESPEGKGQLRLRVSRIGELPEGSTATPKTKSKKKAPEEVVTAEPKELDVVLDLKVLGRYAATAPAGCSKTDALITQTADYLSKSHNFGRLNLGLLGLLSTGEEKYIKVVRDILHDPKSFARPPKDTDKLNGSAMYVSWDWGYRNLLLTEYYLLTGDKYVLPAITQLSRALAAGQDAAGLHGHRMAHPEVGRAYGYGVMNQPSLSIFLSLILAEKCGVKDKVVRDAIQRTHDHYNKWIDVAALGYGNGPATGKFSNNGTSGSLAIAFALLENQKGASFYGSLAAAGTKEILMGHGDPRWGVFWSALGTSVLGPEMTTAYNKKIHWLRTVTRTWNGGYAEIKGWGSTPGANGWSTGGTLINLCAGRRMLHITGKGVDQSLWVDAAKAKEIVDAGELDRSSEQALLKQLGSSFPPIRARAARELAMRDAQVTDEVRALLTKGTRHQKVGAIHAVTSLKIKSVVDELLNTALNEGEDLWVRQLSVGALATISDAKKHAHKLLELLVKDKPYDQPYGELDMQLGRTLVKLYEPDPYATELDKDSFYKGVIKLLEHKHAGGRGAGMELLKNLPREDLHLVVDAMVHLIEDKDKTYTSYNDAGRTSALQILYDYGVKESLDLAVNTIHRPTGRGKGRKRGHINLMKSFGAEAKYLIPRIREVLGKEAEPIIKQIESATTTKKLTPLEDVRHSGVTK